MEQRGKRRIYHRRTWIEVNKNCSYINAEAELQDEDSIFHYYQKLIALRKEYDVIAYGELKPLDEKNPSVLAYEREYQGEKMLVICNLLWKRSDLGFGDRAGRIPMCIEQL